VAAALHERGPRKRLGPAVLETIRELLRRSRSTRREH
jgi:hypothetical protein